MKWKIRFEVAGGHVHMRFFVLNGSTYEGLGDLCVNRGPQFIEFMSTVIHPNKVEWEGRTETDTIQGACKVRS